MLFKSIHHKNKKQFKWYLSKYSIEKIFYYTDGELSKTELYDKKGKLIEKKK